MDSILRARVNVLADLVGAAMVGNEGVVSSPDAIREWVREEARAIAEEAVREALLEVIPAEILVAPHEVER